MDKIYEEIIEVMEQFKVDYEKAKRGNKAAAMRTRKAMMTMKNKLCSEYRAASLEER